VKKRQNLAGGGIDTPSSPSGWDAVSVLSVGLVLNLAIPSYLTVSILGPLGRPAVVWFLGAALWWGWSQLQRPVPLGFQIQPARRFLFLFLGAMLASYALNNFASLLADEARSADSGLLKGLSWAGMFLIANDGITNRERLLVLLRRVATVGALMSTLGLLQSWTGQSFVTSLYLPGFSVGADFDNIQSRAGFLRAAGTASHPLEYAVVLCMSLPIALTLAIYDAKGRAVFRWLSAGVVLVASALSVSRSALIGIATSLFVLLPGWSRTARLRAVIALAAGAVAMYLFIPGMAGTVVGMFTAISDDSSAQSRTNSYAAAFDFVDRSPFFGRGFGTFLPSYRILDNGYLLLLIEIGTVGLSIFMLMVLAGVYCSGRARRRFKDPLMRQLSLALISSLVSGGVMFAFFDLLSFPMAASFIFLTLGMAGAVWRIARNESDLAVLGDATVRPEMAAEPTLQIKQNP
jgi:O-antigen ligase